MEPTRLIFDERFGDNSRQWPSDVTSTAWLAPDGYHLAARVPREFAAVAAPGGVDVPGVRVTATFHKVLGPPGGGFGIIVRSAGPGALDGRKQSGRYYVFEVGDRGEVGLWRREQDTWNELIPWTAAPQVRPGTALNDITVRAVGQQLSLDVNGTRVLTREDATLTTGKVGVFVGGDGNEVVLQRLMVQAIP